MSKKKNRCFKSVQEYQEFYSNSPAEKKLAKSKYYQLGTEAAKLASEQTFKKLDLG